MCTWEEEKMRGWKDLGVVETIYEEEHEEASTSPSLTPPPTNVYSYLQNKVDAWSLATGLPTDVSVHVSDRCFLLHKYHLSSRSSYMKRRLTESSNITLSPPLNITAETFAVIAYFCYSDELLVTPFNVAALRIAAELLEMTEVNGSENLVRKTETYFCQAVAVNREYAAIVLRSCLALLPEAEKTAFLASRCIEALALNDGVQKVDGWVADVTALTAERFQMIADSMKDRFARNHDHLYKMVDLYLKEHAGKLTDEEKTRICSTVDCNRLSQNLLVDAIQNHLMPLRFIVRAMLVEQLNTRRYVLPSTVPAHPHKPQDNDEAVTLGAILQRDAALRQVAQLKLLMDTTSSKIQGLERDLKGMKKQLKESEKKREELESVRSASFRFSRQDDKEVKGGLLSSEKSCDENSRNGRSFRKILMKGLKNVFRTSKRDSESGHSNGGDGDNDDGEVVVVDESWPRHRRNHSFT